VQQQRRQIDLGRVAQTRHQRGPRDEHERQRDVIRREDAQRAPPVELAGGGPGLPTQQVAGIGQKEQKAGKHKKEEDARVSAAQQGIQREGRGVAQHDTRVHQVIPQHQHNRQPAQAIQRGQGGA
jgi:hypothetical protein